MDHGNGAGISRTHIATDTFGTLLPLFGDCTCQRLASRFVQPLTRLRFEPPTYQSYLRTRTPPNVSE